MTANEFLSILLGSIGMILFVSGIVACIMGGGWLLLVLVLVALIVFVAPMFLVDQVDC